MNRASSFNLADTLSPATIHLGLKGRDKDGVLEELVSRIPGLEHQPEGRQTLLRALHEREQLHSTGIGDGIACPTPATRSWGSWTGL
jgi:mannitol/fructose-specific phosphotransferase system IIA component (Ntr-type)